MATAIEIDGLTKRFGAVAAVDHLTLTVEQGSIFGFIGPNGAGKTTTERLLVGLARPTEGTARILGHDIRTDIPKVLPRLGFLPDVPVFYPWMTGPEYLAFVADIFKIPARERAKNIGSLLELADLKEVKTRIGGYSRGMKQRLGIAQALVNDPEVIVMDEPTSALDPIGRKEVLDMIGRLGHDTTVFLSSHILGDIERVCDTVAILNKGRLMTEQTLADLKGRYEQPLFTVELAVDPAPLAEKLAGLPWVVSVEREGNLLSVVCRDLDTGARNIPQVVAELKLPLVSFQAREPSLEDIFVRMIEGA